MQSMRIYLFVLFFLVPGTALSIPDEAIRHEQALTDIATSRCNSEFIEGKDYKITVLSNGNIKVNVFGKKGGGLEGTFEYTREEWEGRQRVLKEHQAAESADRRKCIRAELQSLRQSYKAPNNQSQSFVEKCGLGITTKLFDSKLFGKYSYCQESETKIHLKFEKNIYDRICLIPVTEIFNEVRFIGKAKCIVPKNSDSIYEVEFKKDRNGYQNAKLIGVFFTVDKKYYFPHPYNMYISPTEAAYPALDSYSELTSTFNSEGQYLYHKFTQK